MQAISNKRTCSKNWKEEEDLKFTWLWEADPLTIHYRVVVMNMVLDNMENIIETLDSSSKSKLMDQITVLKINIGEAVEGGIVCKPFSLV